MKKIIITIVFLLSFFLTSCEITQTTDSQLQKELIEYLKKNDELEEQLEEKEEQLNTLQTSYDKLLKEKAETNNTLSSLEEELNTLKEEQEILTNNLEENKLKLETLQSTHDELLIDQEQNKELISSLQEEINTLKEEKETITSSLEEKQTQINSLLQEIESYKENIKTLENEKQELEEQIENLKQQLENNQLIDEFDFVIKEYNDFITNNPFYEGTLTDWLKDTLEGNTCNLYGHTLDEGIITKFSTNTSEGEITYTCEECGEKQIEMLPKLETAEIYEENGIKYLYYGSYPQTHISNTELITELNNLTSTNDRGYFEYNGNEYAKVTATPCETAIKYGTYTYSSGARVRNNKTEWFLVEPIKWRVLYDNNDGSYQLLSEYILDATFYYLDTFWRNIDGVDISPNNYKYSNIRAWLNGYDGTSYNVENYTNKGFINKAFTIEQQTALKLIEVDNSLSSTGDSSNKYICNNTTDKIYLLSYSEATNTNHGFSSSSSPSTTREATVSDYAISKGCVMNNDNTSLYYGNGDWWLRSPDIYNGAARVVDYRGLVNSSSTCSLEGIFVFTTGFGVRVACTINL